MSRLYLAVPLAAALAAVGLATARAASSPSAGALPPDAAAFSQQWPAFNLDLANTRATTASLIDSTNVAKLKPKWRFKLTGEGAFGSFASTPIVLGDNVFLQDLDSNVYALNRSTGALEWKHLFKSSSVGPNGVAYGYDKLFGATETSAFALDPTDGHMLWTRKLTRNAKEGIDMAPTVFNDTVLVSTIPGNAKSFYAGNGDGIVYALDAQTGRRSGASTRSPTGPGSGGTPRSTPAAASGIHPPSTLRAGSSSQSRTRRRTRGRAAIRTAPAGRGRISTPTRSSHSTGRPASSSGTGRSSATTCGTTTLKIRR